MRILLLTIMLLATLSIAANNPVTYVFPANGSRHINTRATILFRFENQLASTTPVVANLVGSVSGSIPFRYTIGDKGHLLTVEPLFAFQANERIDFSFQAALRFISANETFYYLPVEGLHFFTATPGKSVGASLYQNDFIPEQTTQSSYNAAELDTLPLWNLFKSEKVPTYVYERYNPELQAPGYYFLGINVAQNGYTFANMIIDNEGKLVYYKTSNAGLFDFKKLPGGRYSYFDQTREKFMILNSRFELVDSIGCVAGIETDPHELVIDQNGHYYMLGLSYIQMDMSEIVSGGKENATVVEMVIQEFDTSKILVWQWNSLMYIPVTDAVNVNMTGNTVDYMHSNAIEIDTDGNLLLSSRHLNEITKINHSNGRIMWRMGSNAKNNDFIFLYDLVGFAYQHDIRRLPNGNLTLFDNGNFLTPRSSRAVEYNVNELTKVVTPVWQFYKTPAVVSNFMGNAQRLPNENTVIGWGGTNPAFSEVDKLGNIVAELKLPAGVFSYRAFKFTIDSIEQHKTVVPLDTIDICNEDSISVTPGEGFKKAFWANGSGMNSTIKSSGTYSLIAQNHTGFLSEKTFRVNFHSTEVTTKDTTACLGSMLTLGVNAFCPDLKYNWSTGDTTQFISILNNENKTYYVDINNGIHTRRDSLKVSTSSVKKPVITGQSNVPQAFSIITYSVPYIQNMKYDWDAVNGNIISGFDANAISVHWGDREAGGLFITETDPRGCKDSGSMTVTIKTSEPVSGLDEKTLTIKYHPNPVRDKLIIENVVLNPAMQILVVDMMGKVVMTSQLNGNEIDVSQLEKTGLYQMQVYSDGKTYSLTFIKE